MAKAAKGKNSAPVFEVGNVSAVDGSTARARVKIPARDNVESYWLEVLQRGTATDADYWMPQVGDQVRILADEKLESGCILGALYSQATPPPETDPNVIAFYVGGEMVAEFDKSTKILKLNLERIEIVNATESTINSKPIAVIGARDNDTESNGPDVLVTSGQL